MNNNQLNDEIKHLTSQIEQLPLEYKIQLVQEVLKSNGLQVVMNGENHIKAEVVLQIQNGTAEQITAVMRALAIRVEKESIGGERSPD